MSGSTYRVWGWGGPDAEPRAADLAAAVPIVSETLGFPVGPPETPAPMPDLPAPRVRPPTSLAGLASADPVDRAAHAIGRSYQDVLRGIRGQLGPAPDLVLSPRDEGQVAAILDWAAGAGAMVVPYGGGTSVVGGVGPVPEADDRPLLSLDLGRLAGLVDLDRTSLAARFRAGTTGPAADEAIRADGLTLRFYPQSFERSTVGGWLATRAAGHFSTRLQHVDDLVESIRAVTPTGVWESRRLPGSGAGPSPDRLLLGSEGTLGVITEAWLRVQRRPVHRASASLAAPDFATGAAAVRLLVQSGIAPATARLVDATESAVTGTLRTGEATLVLGAESTAEPVDRELERAVEAALGGGLRRLPARAGSDAGAHWRESFKQAPYLRETLVLLGVLVETFETAVTWDRLDELVSSVLAATTAAVRATCGAGSVSCRLTHAYPDGAAPYFTVLAPARRGSEAAQWTEIKAAAGDAVLAAGGTITHHHAVGRDHRRWYDAQRPDPFAAAFEAAKRALDPAGTLNPGVLFPAAAGPS